MTATGCSDPRFAVWIGATAVLFLAAVVVGFIWLPSAQRGADGLDLWNVFCRAVGLPYAIARFVVPAAGQPASTVAWTPHDATATYTGQRRSRRRVGDHLRHLPRRERCQW